MVDVGKITVLIVEDHQLLRSGLRKALEQNERFLVIGEAGDGARAVIMAKELTPSIILMDIGLPVIDGIEAARQIRAAVPSSRLIMLTSCSTDDDVFSALGAGADGYCLKSISEADLFLAIASVHSGAVWLDPQVAARVLKASTIGSTKPASTKDPSKNIQFPLTEREFEVLRLIVDGLSNIEIGARLFISPDTVKTHIRHVLEKLMVSDRTQAAVKALRQGLME